jgi:hypothetical protein
MPFRSCRQVASSGHRPAVISYKRPQHLPRYTLFRSHAYAELVNRAPAHDLPVRLRTSSSSPASVLPPDDAAEIVLRHGMELLEG